MGLDSGKSFYTDDITLARARVERARNELRRCESELDALLDPINRQYPNQTEATGDLNDLNMADYMKISSDEVPDSIRSEQEIGLRAVIFLDGYVYAWDGAGSWARKASDIHPPSSYKGTS